MFFPVAEKMGKFKKNKSGLQASPKTELDSKDGIASASPKMEAKSKKLMKKKQKDKSKAKFEQKMKKKKFKEKEDGGETDDEFTLGKLLLGGCIAPVV
jgi:hypothetical protein